MEPGPLPLPDPPLADALVALRAWRDDDAETLACGPDNAASQAVAARCGFVREGLLRSHMRFKDARRDTVVFGLLPQELR